MSATRSLLDSFASGLATWMIRLRWIVIIAALAGTGFIATNITKLEYSNNYRTFFSKSNPELVNFEAFQATYWHNHLFNATLPGKVRVFGFNPKF